MLELRNITYEVEDNQDNKEILKDVSLTIDEHFVAITGPVSYTHLTLPTRSPDRTVEESPHLQRSLPESSSRHPVRSF